jgi:hypothetical protein
VGLEIWKHYSRRRNRNNSGSVRGGGANERTMVAYFVVFVLVDKDVVAVVDIVVDNGWTES